MDTRTLAPLLALTLAPVGSSPEADGVLERARAALGALAEDAQLEARGTAHSAGLDGALRVVVAGDGRFRLDLDSALPDHSGFDGTRVWSRDRTGLARALELEAADTARLFGWTLSGHWAAAPELDVRRLEPAAGEPKDAPPRLVLALRGTPLEMTLALDPETHLASTLSYSDDGGTLVWSFEDWREIAGRKLPHRWSFDGGAGLDTYRIEAWQTVASDARAFATEFALPGDLRFDPEAAPEIDVERMPSGHLLVEPWVEGESVGLFIFDSGAGAMTIDPTVADALGLDELGEVVAVGVAGRTTASFRRGKHFELGPVTLANPVYVELDLAFLEPIFGRKVAGIVGFDLLARCVAEIETRTPFVALHDPARYALTGASWQDLALHNNTPCVRARFEGEREGLFRIDTGANGTVAFHTPAVQALGLLDGRAVTASLNGGVGGMSTIHDGTLAWFELAGHRFETPRVQFAHSEQGAFADRYTTGNIGQDFLAPFRIVLDYPNDRLAFVELAREKKK